MLAGLTVTALILRAWVLVASGRFGADEAIPGLMARYIVSAHELPVFYWGQAYFGAPESYTIAALFLAFGFHPWLVFVPAVAASVALVPLVWALGEHVGPWPAGLIAALPIAIPPPVLSRMLTNAGGGFSLGFALECGAILCLVRAYCVPSCRTRWVALFSLPTGFAGWVWQPALAALPPLLGVLLAREPALRRPWRLAGLVALAVVGLAPSRSRSDGSTDKPLTGQCSAGQHDNCRHD